MSELPEPGENVRCAHELVTSFLGSNPPTLLFSSPQQKRRLKRLFCEPGGIVRCAHELVTSFLGSNPPTLLFSSPQQKRRLKRLFVNLEGLEPPTFWSVARCSIQLSYRSVCLMRRKYNNIWKLQVFKMAKVWREITF